jgi:hypothetical protein
MLAVALLGVFGLSVHVPPANADPVVPRAEDSTNISCRAAAPDGRFVEIGLNRSVGTDGTELFANAEVFDASGEPIGFGETGQLSFDNGAVSATVKLADHHTGTILGTATFAGTYEVLTGAVVTHGHPLRLEGNTRLIRTTSFAPVIVRWQTYEVAGQIFVQNGQTVLDPGCDGYQLNRDDLLTDPHRVAVSFEDYAMPVSCAVPSLDKVFVVGSDAGLSISFISQGYLGEANLDVRDESTQEVFWSNGIEGEEVFTPIVASLRAAGTPTTEVTTEQGRTVRTTTRPLTIDFDLGLPDGTSTTGSCRLDRISVHLATEPMA